MAYSNRPHKPITNTAGDLARLCKLQKRCTRLAAASDKVYQLRAHGWWFPSGTPASSITKTGIHDITEVLFLFQGDQMCDLYSAQISILIMATINWRENSNLTILNTCASDKVYQLRAHGWWFPSGTPASSITKTGIHDITEILLKVALDTINEIKSLLILDDAVKIQIVEGTGWLTELGSWIT
jgi:hypothetical protein